MPPRPLSPAKFAKLLQERSEKLSLTAGDLAIWFERPRATVYSWLFMGHQPVAGPVLAECERRLRMLDKSRAFPVPYEVRKFARRAYILKAYEDADDRSLPARNPPAKRAEVRSRH